MNYLFVIGYMVFSGMIFGWVINDQSKECGSPQYRMSNDNAAAALLWPVAMGVALVADKENIRKATVCN